MTVTPRMPATVTLHVGRLLVVTAAESARGAVWQIPPNMYGKRSIVAWCESGAITTLGPFPETRTFRVEAITGELDYETKELAVVRLENTIERIRSATVIAKAINEGKRAMSENQTALDKVDAAAAAPAKRPVAPGSFTAGIRAMMDEARAGIVRAREDGLNQVKDAVSKLEEAKVQTSQVARHMAKTIEDEAADVMAELGQLSNMPPE